MRRSSSRRRLQQSDYGQRAYVTEHDLTRWTRPDCVCVARSLLYSSVPEYRGVCMSTILSKAVCLQDAWQPVLRQCRLLLQRRCGQPDGSVTSFDINGPGTGFNNFGPSLATAGVLNANLGTSLAVSGPGTVTFSLWGKEAGYTNQFNYSGSQLFTTAGVSNSVWSNWNSSGAFSVNAGVLDFSYCVIAGGSGCVSNLTNQNSSLGSIPWGLSLKL